MEEVWKTIHFQDFVKSKLPERVIPVVYEINAQGKIRHFYPESDNLIYSESKTEFVHGIEYFSTLLGHNFGIAIRTTLPVADIVKKYF